MAGMSLYYRTIVVRIFSEVKKKQEFDRWIFWKNDYLFSLSLDRYLFR